MLKKKIHHLQFLMNLLLLETNQFLVADNQRVTFRLYQFIVYLIKYSKHYFRNESSSQIEICREIRKIHEKR